MSLDRPWMTALEMQFAALRCDRTVLASGRLTEKSGLVETRNSVKFLPRATAFAWSPDAISAVIAASATIPEDVIVDTDVLPEGERVCWWSFADAPIPRALISAGTWTGAPGTNGDIIGILLVSGANISDENSVYRPAFFFITYTNMALGPASAGWGAVRFGVRPLQIDNDQEVSVCGPDEAYKYGVAVIRFVLAACAWIRQRVVSVVNGPIERHRRKQLLREHGVVVSDVKVITLRRTETQQREDGIGESIEWSCRWIVNGHWRNQFHPSTGKHELKYILPYVKGPSDKPLKVPSKTVYAVTR